MNLNKNARFVLQLTTVLVLFAFLYLMHRNRQTTFDSGSKMVMGTFARVVVVSKNADQAQTAIQNAFDQICEIESLMSDYDPNSQLSLVNRQAFFEPITVEDSLFEVLTASQEYSRLSEGAFDITVGPLVQLWRQAKTTGQTPSKESIQAAKQLIGWQNLILDPQNKTVRFAKEGMKLDLGAIAKGYAVDKALGTLQDAGMLGGMVDIGGNLRCFGTPANRAKHWFIGLQDPRSESKIVLTVVMDERAVATSGDYRRFVEIDHKRYSHIFDPATAESAQTLSSVSIIAPTAMQTDALSTAVTVLGAEKGLSLINSHPQTEAILIQDGSIIKSRNADQYIKK